MSNAPNRIQSVNQIDLMYVEETVPGVTPAGAEWTQLTKVSCDLGLKRQTYTSNRIRPDRRTDQMLDGARRAEGTLQDELTLRDHDQLLAAALCGNWLAGPDYHGAVTVAAGGALTLSDSTPAVTDFPSGLIVNLSGFATPANNGPARILSLVGQILTVDRELTPETAPAAAVAVAGRVLRDGTVVHSFSVEAQRTALTSGAFKLSRGVQVNTAALTLPAEGLVTVNYGLMGLDTVVNDTSAVGTFKSAANGSLFSQVEGEIYLDGEPIAVMTSFDKNIANGITAAMAIGSATADSMPIGKIKITGSMSALLDSSRFELAFEEGAELEMAVKLVTNIGDFYLLMLPRIKLTDCSTSISGEAAASVTAQFEALVSLTHGCSALIQRSNFV